MCRLQLRPLPCSLAAAGLGAAAAAAADAQTDAQDTQVRSCGISGAQLYKVWHSLYQVVKAAGQKPMKASSRVSSKDTACHGPSKSEGQEASATCARAHWENKRAEILLLVPVRVVGCHVHVHAAGIIIQNQVPQ